MEKTIPQKRMRELLASVINDNVEDMRALLINNGVSGAVTYSPKEIQIAVLKAIKDSASFRNDLSSYMAQKVQSGATGFVKQEVDVRAFVDQPGLGFVKQPGDLNFATMGSSTASVIGVDASTATPTQTSGQSSGGSFWSTLGSLASKENLQSLFNTGLNVAATSLNNKANKASEERALEMERLKLQEIQAQAQLNATQPKKGLSTGAWIGIGLGTVAVVVTLVLVLKKK